MAVNKQINVLLIEDSPADTALIREMLSGSKKTKFKLFNARRLEEGLKIFNKNPINVLLLDLNLPDSSGIETFQKAHESVLDVPIVILSGFDDEDTAVKAVKGEAQDYLIKSNVDGNLLLRSIFYAIERKANEVELLKYKNHLEEIVEKRTFELEESNKKLQKEIEERKKAEDEIRASLLEKKILLEEIHNRVENNLHTICNLMGLEYSQINKKEPIEVYQDSQNRMKAVALIHEHLSKSEDFGIIDFGKYIKDMVNYLFRTFAVDSRSIDITIKTHSILLDIDTAVPCGLIINELVTNSIKHAFPSMKNENQSNSLICPEGTCNIDIELYLCQNDYVLEVKDNGVGMPQHFDFRYPETTGMQMVNALVRQLDGLIDLEDAPGTRFKIIFKEFRL